MVPQPKVFQTDAKHLNGYPNAKYMISAANNVAVKCVLTKLPPRGYKASCFVAMPMMMAQMHKGGDDEELIFGDDEGILLKDNIFLISFLSSFFYQGFI